MADEIKMEIVKELGTISETEKNRTLLRYISWNGTEPKYDIRSWYTDKNGNERMSKGKTFSRSELEALYKLIPEALKATETKSVSKATTKTKKKAS